MAIKKVFQPIVDILEANPTRLVKDILPEIVERCTGKAKAPATYHKDEAGNITHIFCAYYKQWLPLAYVEFGVKASSSTGYNSMCKEGAAAWAKTNRQLQASKQDVIKDVMDGKLPPEEGKKHLAMLESQKITALEPHPFGFASLDVALATSTDKLEEIKTKLQDNGDADNWFDN